MWMTVTSTTGHVHGGALAAFADDLGGALAELDVSPGFRDNHDRSKTNIFRACVPGRLTGVAVPVHVGRRMIVLQISIYRPDGKLAAMMVQTQMVLPRELEKPPSSSEMIVPLGIAPLRFSRNHGNYLAHQHTAAFPTVGPGVRIRLPPARSLVRT